jgi:hypothetical protein
VLSAFDGFVIYSDTELFPHILDTAKSAGLKAIAHELRFLHVLGKLVIQASNQVT